MNDHWNNPPEEPEVNCPKCGEPADFVRKTEDGDNYCCTACGHEFREAPEQDVNPFDGDDEVPLVLPHPDFILVPTGSSHCPHGEKIGECQACDIAADFAFDAARERG